jgi:hypothetical protein
MGKGNIGVQPLGGRIALDFGDRSKRRSRGATGTAIGEAIEP